MQNSYKYNLLQTYVVKFEIFKLFYIGKKNFYYTNIKIQTSVKIFKETLLILFV